MRKELNLSCRATFKDGSTQDFETIEAASESTGLSVASIKIRCNRKGCGGKDNTLFEWLDPHTKKSFQAKKSKNKGSALEYEVIKRLKEIGYSGCVTAKGESKRADNDKIDIVDTNGELGVNIQCKHYANTPSYFTIRDQCSDKSKPFVVVWKKSAEGDSVSPGTIAMLPIEFFYELIKKN